MLGGALLACSWIPFTITYTYINATVCISAHRSFSPGTIIVARAFPDHPRNQPRSELAAFEAFGEPVAVAGSLLRARSHTVGESVSHVCAPACSCLWFFPGFAATRELARTPKSNPTSLPLPYLTTDCRFCTPTSTIRLRHDSIRSIVAAKALPGVLAAFRTRSVCNIISQPHGLPQLLHTTHCARSVIAPSTTDRRNLSRARTQPAPT
jgi:hypothetical protein